MQLFLNTFINLLLLFDYNLHFIDLYRLLCIGHAKISSIYL